MWYTPCSHILICDHGTNADRGSQDCRMHRLTFYPRPPFVQTGRKRLTVADRCSIRRYGVGIVMLFRVVPTLVNRVVRSLPSACAPTAIARATNTINMAYSVAVAPSTS